MALVSGWSLTPDSLSTRKSCRRPAACARQMIVPVALSTDELGLQRVALFLARIVAALLFLGRSTGGSVASMRTISYFLALVRRAFLPGSVNAPLLMSTSSHQRILRYAVLS